MPRKHPDPVDALTLPTFRDLDPVLSIGGVAAYFGVSKVLASRWARESKDWPAPIAKPPSGTLYATAAVIEWGKAHERPRGGGPREAGDPTPPSQRKRVRRRTPAQAV
jgi:hypothetical protein